MFKTFLESLKRPDNQSLIETIQEGYQICFEAEKHKDALYPPVRLLTSYESLKSIIEMKSIYSRPMLMKKTSKLDDKTIKEKGLEKDDEWWKKREENDLEKFKTTDLIFCTVDWFNDKGHETGHGPIMIYLKPIIFDDFKLTLTPVDSLSEKKITVYNKKDISKIYSFIKNIDIKSNDKLYNVARKIYNNLDKKNDGGFYDHYAEIQIHADKIPTKYIDHISFTDNYFNKSKNDKKHKDQIITLLKNEKIKSLNESILFENKESNPLIETINKFLKSPITDMSVLKSKELSGGWCWYYTMKFKELLDNKNIDNEIWYLTGSSHGQHFINYIIDKNIIIDFTYRQINPNSDIPVMTKEKDFDNTYSDYIGKKIFKTFDDFWKSWDFKSFDDFLKHMSKEGNPAAQFLIGSQILS